MDGSTVEGQHGQRLHRPPVKHTNTMVPACGGQDLVVWPDFDIRDARIGEFVSSAHLHDREQQGEPLGGFLDLSQRFPPMDTPRLAAGTRREMRAAMMATHSCKCTPYLLGAGSTPAEGSCLTPAVG